MSSYNNEDLHSFRLKLSQQHYYPHNLDCQLQIQAQRDSENIMFYFKYFDVRPYQLPESFCNYDWLELHDGNSTDNQYVCGIDMKLCGISPSRTLGVYFTRSNYLTLYFKSDDQEKYTGFEMVITRFRYGQCRSDEYACGNGRCIDQSLQCNGYNACGDGSDCSNLHPGYIMSIVAAALVVISVIANITLGILLCKCRKSKRIVPHCKTPLNAQLNSACPSFQEGLSKYGTVTQRPIKLPSESTDLSRQAPLNSLLDPPCTTVSSHNTGTQSLTTTGKSQNNPDVKHFEHGLSNGDSNEDNAPLSHETDSRLRQRNRRRHEDRLSSVTDYKQGDTKRSKTEPTICSAIEESTCDHETTYPKSVCSCGNLRQDISGFGFQRPHSSRDSHLDSGYNTTRPRPADSCLDNTYRKLLYDDENTEAKQLHSATRRTHGTPVRGEVDSNVLPVFHNSIN